MMIITAGHGLIGKRRKGKKKTAKKKKLTALQKRKIAQQKIVARNLASLEANWNARLKANRA